VGGIAAYADVNSGPFSIGARYTKALQTFSPADLPTVYALQQLFFLLLVLSLGLFDITGVMVS